MEDYMAACIKYCAERTAMYQNDFKNIVLENFDLGNSISNTEEFHNIKTWLRYQLFPCKDADSILKNPDLLEQLEWPHEKNIYIDCIFSMKTYFNMFLRMYNIKAAQSYAWLLLYFDDIFSQENISKFCYENSINETILKNCLTQQERLARNTHTLGNYMTCPDSKYNDLKGLSGYTVFNDRIELILNAFVNKELGKIQFIGYRNCNWIEWFNQNINKLRLQTLFVNNTFDKLENCKIKEEFLEFQLHDKKIKNSYRFVPSELQAYTAYLTSVNEWIENRTSCLNALIQQHPHA